MSLCALGFVAWMASTAAAAPVDPPLTFDRLWYRSDRKRSDVGVFNRPGDLTIDVDRLEYVTRKNARVIPFDRIAVISYGTMRGDPDTPWAILRIGSGPDSEIIGLRDGSKLGYGGRTQQIYTAVRNALRKAGAAQYDVPEGTRAFEGIRSQCMFAVPDSWSTRVESVVHVEDRSPWGEMLFSSVPTRRESPDGGRPIDDEEALARIESGSVAAFRLTRSKRPKKSSCSEPGSVAAKQLKRLALESDTFAPETARVSNEEYLGVDGCKALRIVARGKGSDGTERVVELVGVTRGDTWFVFGLRSTEDGHAAHRSFLADTLGALRFSIAGDP